MATTAVSAPSDIRQNVIDAFGHTPLVRLNRVTKGIRTPVAAKLEMLNPGGSVKDRIGIRMIEEAERKGWLQPGRHDRRTDQRQHRRRTGHRGGGQGLLLHLRHAGQGRARESRPPARLRRPSGHHANRGRARFARELLLGGRPADARGAERVPAEPVLQPDEPAHALRNDRPRDLGAERRAGDPLRGRGRHRGHDLRRREVPQRAQPVRPGHRGRPRRQHLHPTRRHAHLQGGGRRRGLLAGHVRPDPGRCTG